MSNVAMHVDTMSQVPRVLGLECQDAVGGAVEFARENREGMSIVAGGADERVMSRPRSSAGLGYKSERTPQPRDKLGC